MGGGAAGLWTLDLLHGAGYRVLLLEAHALGAGQTVASQGIIHGGLKYTLDGLFNPSADAIRDMPQAWRDCLAGRRRPHLTRTRVQAEYCHLWRTDHWSSQVGMLGARLGLRVRPEKLPVEAWPAALRGCPGSVYRLDEQVIDCVSLIADLFERHRRRILAVEPGDLTPEVVPHGPVAAVTISAAGAGRAATIKPARVILTAGAGNAELRRRMGLAAEAMQRRPLHMALVRGDLPTLNGHCTEGARTRVTITTVRDAHGRTVWQVGGQLAEDGVSLSEPELIAHAKRELAAVVPGACFRETQWSTYRVDRAEAAAGGKRPNDAWQGCEGNVITVWPTKLALAPRAAEAVLAALPAPDGGGCGAEDALADWPRPGVAKPPWDAAREWRD